MPTTFTRDELPVVDDDITKPGQGKQWKYLEPVANQLNLEENISVGLLIGGNCTKALKRIQVLQSRNGGPYAFRTRLGWCVVRPVSGTKNSSILCNKITVRQADTNQVGKHFFQSKKEVKENDITEMLGKMYKHEFTESQHKLNRENEGMSQEDPKFMQVLMKSHSHYMMIMSDSQITDYKLRRGLHICKEKRQGTINSRMTI